MKKILLIILLLLNLSLPAFALANSGSLSSYQVAQLSLDSKFKPDNSPNVIIQDGNAADYGNYFLQLIAGGLIYLAAPVAIIIIAVAGLLAVISSGDSGLVDKAKNSLKWAVIGLVIIIFSWMIINTVITLIFNSNPTDSNIEGQSQQSQSENQPPSDSTSGESPSDGDLFNSLE